MNIITKIEKLANNRGFYIEQNGNAVIVRKTITRQIVKKWSDPRALRACQAWVRKQKLTPEPLRSELSRLALHYQADAQLAAERQAREHLRATAERQAREQARAASIQAGPAAWIQQAANTPQMELQLA